MTAFRIKEMMKLRGFGIRQLMAAMGWDREKAVGAIAGRLPLTADDLCDVSEWLDVPVWALMPDTRADKLPYRAMVEDSGAFREYSDPARLAADLAAEIP